MVPTKPSEETELKSAAQWLVDIWANNAAIEYGSALWEDIQRVRTALEPTEPRCEFGWHNLKTCPEPQNIKECGHRRGNPCGCVKHVQPR